MKVFEKDPAQEAAIELFSNPEQTAGLNGSGTGVGKTYIAVQSALNRGARRVLIIAPPNSFDNWEATLMSLAGIQLRPCANAKLAAFKPIQTQANMAAAQAGEDGWFFVGREMFNTQNWYHVHSRDGKPKYTDKKKPVMRRSDIWSKKRPFDFAVFDEVQLCSAVEARTRQSWQHLGVTDSYTNGSTRTCGFKLAQSADFFGSKLENIYTVTEDLWPGHSGLNRTEWIDEYFVTKYDHYAFSKKQVVDEKWPGFYVSTLPCYVAIPSPVDKPEPEPRYVDLSPAQRKLYDKLQEDMVAEIEGDILVVEMDMHLTMRLRELTLGMFHVVPTTRINRDGDEEPWSTIDYRPGDVSTTVDEAKAIMKEHPGEPMIILTHSQKFAEKMAADLGGLPYTGKQSLAQKKEAERAFKAGEIRVLVGTESICEALDGLQDICRIAIIASRVWTPYKVQQFLGRIARRGQQRPVLAYEIVRRGTIDVGVVSDSMAKTLKLNAAKALAAKQKKEAK